MSVDFAILIDILSYGSNLGNFG